MTGPPALFYLQWKMTLPETFIDTRIISYLRKNFDEISKILNEQMTTLHRFRRILNMPYTININGLSSSGKSTLLSIIRDNLKEIPAYANVKHLFNQEGQMKSDLSILCLQKASKILLLDDVSFEKFAFLHYFLFRHFSLVVFTSERSINADTNIELKKFS